MHQVKNNFHTYVIKSKVGRTKMSFAPERGGAAYSLIMQDQNNERELLYLHDCFWDKEIDDLPGGWPFCFPICARLERMGQLGNYLYDGHVYHLPIHGFGWQLPWKVIDHKEDEIILSLRDTPQTLSMYPFKFEVKLHYKLSDNLMICEQTYTNLDHKPMPYSAGFHPYFLTPALHQGKENVILNYQAIKRFIYNLNLTDLIGETELFTLPTSITQPEINEQLTLLGAEKRVELIYPDGFTIEMQAKGVEDPDLFSYIQLYHVPEKPFFCIEPWMGFPNAMNTVKGMRWLQPQQSEHGKLIIKGYKSGN